ncbi:MAG TPA: hypothetical protein PKW08_06880 [Flavobacteriaceae bacterium]|nr:hypothetical protein [Flavobacteriaceae bacterium]MCB9212806.1 hypothetical protein [Alteromonas sp.]HPF12257.1 hypothetical protein [Flavobacteriaceae bacterium]HQU21295.1 hypothetical protein [Flavobacteriaceae bacterium]HQU66231.1 hypothetical protein [Flavobacteriaceae bacterium]
MKNLFKIIAFSFVMFLGMSTMSGQTLKQDQNSPEVIAKQKTADLSDKLGLNGDQQRAVFRALVVKENSYAKDINGKDLSNANVMAAKKKYDATLDENMKKALTEEQYKRWLTIKDDQ